MSWFGFGSTTSTNTSGTNLSGQQLMNPNGQGQQMGQNGQQANNSRQNNLTKMLHYLNYNNQKNKNQLKLGLVPATQELLPAQLSVLQQNNMNIPPQIYTTNINLGTNLIYMGKIWNNPQQPGQQPVQPLNQTGQQPGQQTGQQPGQQTGQQTGQQPEQGFFGWGGLPETNQPENSGNNKKEDLFYPNETNIQINNTKNLETIKNEGVNSTNKNLVFMRENGSFVLNQLSGWGQNYSCNLQMNQTNNNRNGKPKYKNINNTIWYYIFECPDAPANSGQTAQTAQPSTGFGWWGGKHKKPTKKPVRKTPIKKPVKKTPTKKPVKKPVKKPIEKFTTKKPIKEYTTKKPIKKSSTKNLVKKPTKKPVKKPVKKPIEKFTTKKPIKEYTTKKPIKKSSTKNLVKKPTKKPVVKKPIKKPTTKPVVKKTTKKPKKTKSLTNQFMNLFK